MSYLKTAILLAGLTGLFMGVGYLIGGASGALIALVIAAEFVDLCHDHLQRGLAGIRLMLAPRRHLAARH